MPYAAYPHSSNKEEGKGRMCRTTSYSFSKGKTSEEIRLSFLLSLPGRPGEGCDHATSFPLSLKREKKAVITGVPASSSLRERIGGCVPRSSFN